MNIVTRPLLTGPRDGFQGGGDQLRELSPNKKPNKLAILHVLFKDVGAFVKANPGVFVIEPPHGPGDGFYLSTHFVGAGPFCHIANESEEGNERPPVLRQSQHHTVSGCDIHILALDEWEDDGIGEFLAKIERYPDMVFETWGIEPVDTFGRGVREIDVWVPEPAAEPAEPAAAPEGDKMADWLAEQVVAEMSGKLSPEKIAKLDSIGEWRTSQERHPLVVAERARRRALAESAPEGGDLKRRRGASA